jgi:hypothetical protein
LRLKLVAGVSFALALPAVAIAADSPRSQATETELSAETHDLNGRTQATLSVSVVGQDGLPAQGAVVIADKGKQLAGVALDASGHATTELSLLPGEHALTASYAGNTAHQSSVSQVRPVSAVTGTAPDFSVAVSPATLTLKQGQSGASTASITPINAASLTAPMFVTLSCSGLPDQATCSFTPENVEISPNTTAAVNSSLVLTTVAQSQAARAVPSGSSTRTALALLLPGALGFVGLAYGARRRRWLSRMSLVACLGLIALGTTACNPLYNYRNHGPSPNLPTPKGPYTLVVTAQSSNGITATTHSTSLVLTVQ